MHQIDETRRLRLLLGVAVLLLSCRASSALKNSTIVSAMQVSVCKMLRGCFDFTAGAPSTVQILTQNISKRNLALVL